MEHDVFDRTKDTNELVYPGTRLAVTEEFIAGSGTYSTDDYIFSAITGHVMINIEKHEISILPKPKSSPNPKNGDVFLGGVPFSNTFGLTATILACTMSGAQLVSLKRYNPAKALEVIEASGITVHHGVPTMFALELNHPSFRPEKCATLRTGIMSGAYCPPELVSSVREKMGCDVILAYGLAEASPSAATRTRSGASIREGT